MRTGVNTAMKRREFLTTVTAAGLGAAAAGSGLGQNEAAGTLKRRRYGNTDDELSIVGFGGIIVSEIPQAEANDTVAWAVDRGVNYFDVAPTYGNAQERLGPALKPYRDQSFLACKTTRRDAAGAQAELEESLRLLQTDHLDLYQFHGLTKIEDVEKIMGPGGALETFVEARDKGQARFLGFSAHSEEAALKAMNEFDFDSVLFPFNVVCLNNGNFGHRVLKTAQEKRVACLSLKAMAWTKWPEGAERTHPKCWYQPVTDRELARLALSYALDLPITAAIPPGDGRLFRLGVELALSYRPLSKREQADLLLRVGETEPIFRPAA